MTDLKSSIKFKSQFQNWKLFVTCILCVEFSFAQQTEKDSLLSLLKTSKEDTNKIITLIHLCEISDVEDIFLYAKPALKLSEKLGYETGIAESCYNIGYYYKNIETDDSALIYYLKCQKIWEKNNYTDGMAESLYSIGLIYDNRGEPEMALKYLTKSLKLREASGNEQSVALALNSIGFVHQNLGQPAIALDYFMKSLKIWEQIGDTFYIANCISNIGVVYENQNQLEKAQEYFMNALKLRESIGDIDGTTATLNNISAIFVKQGQLEKALDYFFKCAKIRETTGDKQGAASSYNNIGSVYLKQKKADTALVYFEKSLAINREIKNEKSIALNLNNIAKIFHHQKKIQKAVAYCKESFLLANKLKIPDIAKKASETLSEIYASQKDFRNAYEYHKLFTQYKDSIFNEESSKQIAEMQTKYETEKKEKQIQIQELEIKNKEAEVKRQNLQKTAFAAGFAIVLVLAFVIFRSLKITRNQKKIIELQKQNVEKAKQLIEEKNKDITDSLEYAKGIQQTILPSEETLKKFFPDSFILFKPKDIVSGDFYWLAQSTDLKSVLLAVADCTGHGVPGAFVSMVCASSLTRSVIEHNLTKPGEILDKTAQLVEENLIGRRDGMDISLVKCTRVNGKCKIEFAGANNSLWLVENGVFREVGPDRQPIGKFENRKPFITHTISPPLTPPVRRGTATAHTEANAHGNVLPNGEDLGEAFTFYLFSDGYPDQFGGPKGKKFKYSQFEKLLVSIHDKSMDEQREILNKTIDDWRGSIEQVDDICVIGVRI